MSAPPGGAPTRVASGATRIARGERRHIDPAWTVIARCRDALAGAGIHQWDDVYPTRAVVEDDVARGTLWVLERSGDGDASDCVGCVALDDRQAPGYRDAVWEAPEPALVVHRLCVDPAAQGQGLARRLMDFAEAHARAQGYRSVRLDAYSANARSVALYRARGYREAGQTYFARRPLPFHLFELAVDG